MTLSKLLVGALFMIGSESHAILFDAKGEITTDPAAANWRVMRYENEADRALGAAGRASSTEIDCGTTAIDTGGDENTPSTM